MSTLKVDTYLTRGGASEIAIDKIKGVTAAGSMLVVGEGGTTTTNLQQGLSKTWHKSNDAASVEDSLNVSGGTDNGTGNYTFAFSNNIGNATYAHPHSTCLVNCCAWSHTRAAASMRIEVFMDAGNPRDAETHGTVHGDLA